MLIRSICSRIPRLREVLGQRGALSASSRAPFAAGDDARAGKSQGFESAGDLLRLPAEDAGENQPAARLYRARDARGGRQEDVAEEIGQNDVEGPAEGEFQRITARNLDRRKSISGCVFLGDPHRDRIVVDGLDPTGAKRLCGDGEDSCASPEVEGGKACGEFRSGVREKPQAGGSRGVLAGPKSHPCRDEDSGRFPGRLLPSAPGRPIGENFELSTDGQGGARTDGVARPDVPGQFGGASAEAFHEAPRGAFVAIDLDLKGAGVRPRDKSDCCRIEEAQAFDPGVLPLGRTQACPAVKSIDHSPSRVFPHGFPGDGRTKDGGGSWSRHFFASCPRNLAASCKKM